MIAKKSGVAALLLIALSLLVAACGGSDSDDSGSGEIKIGTSLPLTGGLAPFGPLLEAGAKQAVAETNEEGGVEIDGEKQEVQLIVKDSASEPNKVSEQLRTMVLKEGAVGLLGSVSPPLAIPASSVADSLQVPLVTSATPGRAWIAGNPDGWTYAWDIFFDENQMTDLQFETADLTKTNKKIALFTDNEGDGIAMGELWEGKAGDFGYEIASHAEFPVGTTDYSTFISEAERAGAEIVVAQMVPSDAFALWKQMKAVGYQPELAFCEKCAASGAWQAELGPLADGTLVARYWSPESGGEGSQQIIDQNGDKYPVMDLSVIAASYTATMVLLDAMAAADSTEPEAINEALAELEGDYPLGSVKFDDQNFAPVEAKEAQWQGADVVQVFPEDGNQLVAPVPGLGG